MNPFSKGPVYKRWWFWVGVIALALGALYLKGYLEWRGEGYAGDAYNAVSGMYATYLKNKAADLEAAYRADTYGGDTPEETLRLFVEALEKKDFELAAKYFVVENQESALKENYLGESGGSNSYFINAYRNGRISSPESNISTVYEIEVFPPGEEIGFGVRLIENEFTSKWKILEL